MIGFIGNKSELWLLKELSSNIDVCSKENKYKAVFVCLDTKSTSKAESAAELFNIFEQFSSKLYIVTGVVPVGTMDLLSKKTGRSFVKFVVTSKKEKENPGIVVGGSDVSLDLFKQYLPMFTVYKTSFAQSELYHLIKKVEQYSDVTTSKLINKAYELSKIKGLENSFEHLKGMELASDSLLYSVQLLEIYYQTKGIQTYLLNAFRREFSLNLRQQSNYKLPYSHVDSGSLYFHDVDQEFGCFSNFSEHPVFIGGVIWKTVEHFYQAQKFIDPEVRNKIRLSQSPVLAKEIAWDNKDIEVSVWNMKKQSVMLTGLQAKFHQHPELKKVLLSTGNRIIYEYSYNDNYWGDSGDKKGQNKLGKLLMEVRFELIQSDKLSICVD